MLSIDIESSKNDLILPQKNRNLPINMFGIIVAAMIGNMLEIYDMIVYGYFAVIIAEHFFLSKINSPV